MPAYMDSDLVIVHIRDSSFLIPEQEDRNIEHKAERPVYEIQPTSPLDLNLDLSPRSSSRYSSDDEDYIPYMI